MGVQWIAWAPRFPSSGENNILWACEMCGIENRGTEAPWYSRSITSENTDRMERVTGQIDWRERVEWI